MPKNFTTNSQQEELRSSCHSRIVRGHWSSRQRTPTATCCASAPSLYRTSKMENKDGGRQLSRIRYLPFRIIHSPKIALELLENRLPPASSRLPQAANPL